MSARADERAQANEDAADEARHLHLELFEAKDAVEACLADGNVSVNFHGLTYWAGRVEALRKQIAEAL